MSPTPCPAKVPCRRREVKSVVLVVRPRTGAPGWLLVLVLVLAVHVPSVTGSPTTSTPTPPVWEHLYLDGCGEGVGGGGEARLVSQVSVNQLLTPRGYFLMELLSDFDPVLVSSSGLVTCFAPSSPTPPPPPPSPHDASASDTSTPTSSTGPSPSAAAAAPAATSPSASLVRVYTRTAKRRVTFTFKRTKEGNGTHEGTAGGGRTREVVLGSCTMLFNDRMDLRAGYGFFSCRESKPETTDRRLVAWRETVSEIQQQKTAAKRQIILGVAIGVSCMLVACVVCVVCRLVATRKPRVVYVRRPSASTRSTNTGA